MAQPKLILVRHGECLKSGTYCGLLDAPLTEAGRRQACAVGDQLSALSIECCYASPLSRAYETAQIICSARQIPITVSAAIKEIDFGLWEGLNYAQIAERWPELAKRWLTNPAHVDIPGGEAFAAFRGRVRRFLEILSHQGQIGNTLVVAHGGSIAAILMELRREPASKFASLIPPLGAAQEVDWPPQACQEPVV